MNPSGQRAEDRALAFLQRRGLRLVERNWRCRGGEIDLIMLERQVRVFVEVRQRSRTDFGGALASITPEKCRRLQLAATLYLQCQGLNQADCRFDAVVIEANDRLTWVKNIIA
jgi:putative endonuclease